MKIKKYHIYLANLDPKYGTEPGKTRPVAVVQTDLLNNKHPSTIVCPITTNVTDGTEILRVHVSKGETNLKMDSDIMLDQIRAIDNKRLIKELGMLNRRHQQKIMENLSILMIE